MTVIKLSLLSPINVNGYQAQVPTTSKQYNKVKVKTISNIKSDKTLQNDKNPILTSTSIRSKTLPVVSGQVFHQDECEQSCNGDILAEIRDIPFGELDEYTKEELLFASIGAFVGLARDVEIVAKSGV